MAGEIFTKSMRKILGSCLRKVAGAITNVVTEAPVASLTFDDGPDPVCTPKVLDILKQYDVRATFFMVGEGAQNYPDIVKQVAIDGHAIGNHSWNHLAFPLISLAERWGQIRKCRQALAPYGERLFRPPYGMSDKKSNIEMLLQGYEVIGWSFSSEDWCEKNSKVISNNLANNIKPGDIVLLHDRYSMRGSLK